MRRHGLSGGRVIPSWTRWAWLVLTGTAWSAVALREQALKHPELFEAGAPGPLKPEAAAPKGFVKQMKAAVSEGMSEHDIPRRGASLAYYTVFSMAPLVLIMIAVVGFFLGEEAAKGAVVGQMQGFLGGEKASVIQDMVAAANRPGASAASGIIGVAVLLLGASAVVGELQSSLMTIWGVPQAAAGIGGTIKNRLISMAFVLGMGFLLLVSLFLSTGAAAAGKYLGSALGVPEAALQGLNFGLSLGVITCMFAAMFKFLPKAGASWRQVFPGALATAVMFTVGNTLLGLYLGKAGPSSTYGAAGSLLTILLWTYYCSQILFFGAEYTRVSMGRPARAPTSTKGEAANSARSASARLAAPAAR